MYILDDQIKRKLGILIEYYRSYYYGLTKDKQWQKYNFLLYFDGVPICSDKTYNRLIKGDVSHNDEMYDKLLMKLKEDFVVPPAVLATINIFVSKIFQLIEYRDENGINALTNKVLEILDPYKEIIYYREVYELFQIVQNYYVNGLLMTKQQYAKYCAIIDVFYPVTQSIMKGLLFRYCQYAYFDDDKLKRLYDKLDIEKETSSIHRLSQLQILMIEHRFFEAKEHADILMAYAKETNNYSLLVTVMSLDVTITWLADRSQFDEKWRQIGEVLFDNTVVIGKLVKAKCMITVGMVAYSSNHKELAYQLFRDAILYSPTYFYLVGNYLRHLEDVLQLPKTDYTAFEKYPTTERFDVIYGYYKMRDAAGFCEMHTMQRVDASQKAKLYKLDSYLYRNVMPTIHLSDSKMIYIFLHEFHVVAGLIQSYTNLRKYFVYFSLGTIK